MKSILIRLRAGLVVYAISMAVFVNVAASSDTRPPASLTFSEAIQFAVANNPGIKAAQSKLDAAQTRITQARSGFLPQVYFLSLIHI